MEEFFSLVIWLTLVAGVLGCWMVIMMALAG